MLRIRRQETVVPAFSGSMIEVLRLFAWVAEVQLRLSLVPGRVLGLWARVWAGMTYPLRDP